MRIVFAALAGALVLLSTAHAEGPGVRLRDPSVYAQTFADSMALSGMRPIRDAFTAMLGPTPLSAEVESGLQNYERAISGTAQVSRVIDDLELGGAYRVVYLYHYFDEDAWVFTRMEFLRISDTDWMLARVTFADRWANVALATTPSFERPRSTSRR